LVANRIVQLTKKKNPIKKNKKQGFALEMWKNWPLYIMTLPGIIFLLVFSYYPFLGIQMAFREFNIVDGIWHSPFVGLKYFKAFFKSKYFGEITINTLYLNILFLIAGLVTAVTIAILLNEMRSNKLKKLFQSAMFFPYFLSWVIISAIVYSFLNDKYGALNTFLLGLGLQSHTWYNMAELWRTILTFISTWQSFGYTVIIYLAVIVSIDSEIYEAASIDGANRITQIFKITLPLLIPTIVLLSLLALGHIFNGNFGMIYSIIGDNGALISKTDVIDTYVFRTMRVNGAFSLATAVGLFQSVFGFIVVLIFNKLAKLYDDSMGLF
jgi:putative aldouronate transport system permease protein